MCISTQSVKGWGAGMVICIKQVADLHMSQLMPLPLTVSCFSKIQIATDGVVWLFTCLLVMFVCPAKTSELIAMSLGWERVGPSVTMY